LSESLVGLAIRALWNRVDEKFRDITDTLSCLGDRRCDPGAEVDDSEVMISSYDI